MRHDAVQSVGKGRLPRPRRAGDADERAIGNTQIHVGDGAARPFAIPEAHVGYFNHDRRHILSR